MRYVGKRIAGLNNRQLVAGKGCFVADVELPGMTHCVVVRSPFAHARIRAIDKSAAERVPGVLCVVTGEEILANTNPIPGSWEPSDMDAKEVQWYALAVERVRYVGEAVAAVVAETLFAAEEAATLLDIDYEELPAVIDPMKALRDDSPLIEPDWGDNILVSRTSRPAMSTGPLPKQTGSWRGSSRATGSRAQRSRTVDASHTTTRTSLF